MQKNLRENEVHGGAAELDVVEIQINTMEKGGEHQIEVAEDDAVISAKAKDHVWHGGASVQKAREVMNLSKAESEMNENVLFKGVLKFIDIDQEDVLRSQRNRTPPRLWMDEVEEDQQP